LKENSNKEKKNKWINITLSQTIAGALSIFLVSSISWIGLYILNKRHSSKNIPSETFATFEDHTGQPQTLTNWGDEWGIFGDSKFNCRSITFWSLKETSTSSNNYVMQIKVNFPICDTSVRRYTGIYAYMSCMPHGIFDLTSYSGISFDFGVSERKGSIDIFVQLADTITPLRAWHIVLIDFDKTNISNSIHLHTFYIPFSNFVYPSWYQPQEFFALDLSQIYKISFLFMLKLDYKGEAHGTFYLDNIRFVKYRKNKGDTH
jgi:hypothetical protein